MTAVAVRDSAAIAPRAEMPRATHALAQMMYDHAADIAPFLPEGVSFERVVAGVGVCLAKLPALARCTPQSVILGVSKIVQWGLEIGETAHLLPYGTEATPVRDYKGDIELLIATGVCRDVDAHCVYESELDTFKVTYGTNGGITHNPNTHKGARGKMVGVYAIFWLRFGHEKHLYMTVEEVDEVRQRYSKQWKSGEMPYWYAFKTVIKRGAKLIPRNPRLAKVLAMFEDEESLDLDPTLEVAHHAPAIAGRAEQPAAAQSPRAETGEAATDKQLELLEKLAKSHHWNADELLAIRRRIGSATKEKAMKMIDGMTETIKARGAEERAAKLEQERIAGIRAGEAKGSDGLPNDDDDLPF